MSASAIVPILLKQPIFLRSVQPYVSATAMRVISPNDPVFEGHFPDNPILPGVLTLHSLFSLSERFVRFSLSKDVQAHLSYITRARFIVPVRPPCQLSLGVDCLEHPEDGFGDWLFDGVVSVKDIKVAEALFRCTVIDRPAERPPDYTS
eukprot:Rmarinus@m.20154